MKDSNEYIFLEGNGQSFEILREHLPFHIHTDAGIPKALAESSQEFFAGQTRMGQGGSTPLLYQYEISMHPFLPHINDPALKKLCTKVIPMNLRLKGINAQLLDEVGLFLKYGKPQTEEERQKIGRKRYRYKNGTVLPWLNEPRVMELLAELEKFLAHAVQLENQIVDELVRVYEYSYFNEFGDQRAKDLIRAGDHSNEKEAIALYNKALRYGEETFYGRRALNELGRIHKQRGEIDLAIDYYSRSLVAADKISVNTKALHFEPLLYRGLLYLQQGNKMAGLKDLELGIRHAQKYGQFTEGDPILEVYDRAMEILEDVES